MTPEYKLPEYKIPYYEDNSRVSNSAIGWFLNKGPAYFHRMLQGEEKGLDLPQLRRGTMIHEFLLQPEEFKKDYMLFTGNKPKSAQGQKFCEAYISSTEIEPNKRAVDAYNKSYSIVGKSDEKVLSEALKMSEEYKDYIEALKENKILISQYDYTKLLTVKSNILEHKLARKLLQDAGDYGNVHIYHEFQINWEYIGVPCKSLLDCVMFDFDNRICTIMDIKTTSKLWHFEDSMEEFDYARQLQFYKMAVGWWLEKHKDEIGPLVKSGENIQYENGGENGEPEYSTWIFKFYIVAIDNSDNSEVRVFNVYPNTDTRYKILDAVKAIRYHMKTDEWDHSIDYYTGDGSENLNL